MMIINSFVLGPPPSPPATPTGFTVLGDLGLAYLDWDAQGDADGFYIERAPDDVGSPGTYTQIVSVSGASIDYTDSPVSSGSYWWRIRAYNAGGNSAYTSDTLGSVG